MGSGKYRWNSEFIKLINQRECPYCGKPLTVRRLCKGCKCSFYLLGAAETLAYERISENAPTNVYYGDTLGSEICPDCGNTDFIEDHSRAEKICTCGLVIQGPPAYSSYIKISYDSFKGVSE
jgi:hypothetical protein